MSTASLIFASDFAPIRRFASVMDENSAAVYGDLLSCLTQTDYRIVNLECPLDPANGFITKSGAAFSGQPSHISSLFAGGFNTVITANNHTFDCGSTGFYRTRELLEKNGIFHVGAGANLKEARKPLSIQIHGIRIGIFAISEGEDLCGATETSAGVRPWEVEYLADQIHENRKNYDFILVSAHCGLEYQPYPSYYVYEAFRIFADAGADIIIGHHPHVPQGMTYFDKVPAYFSLGNFVFYQPTPLFYRKIGFMVKLEISGSGLLSHKKIPYLIGENGLRLMTDAENKDFESLFAELSEPLKTEHGAKAAWHAVLAYNGMAGFESELEKILANMRECPGKGAAMLRNRVTCIQHRSQWIDGMSRIIDGTINDVPEEYINQVKKYMTEEVR